jgi:hypothetical protein
MPRRQGCYAREDGASRLSQEITAVHATGQVLAQHTYFVVKHRANLLLNIEF